MKFKLNDVLTYPTKIFAMNSKGVLKQKLIEKGYLYDIDDDDERLIESFKKAKTTIRDTEEQKQIFIDNGYTYTDINSGGSIVGKYVKDDVEYFVSMCRSCGRHTRKVEVNIVVEEECLCECEHNHKEV